MTTMLEMEEAYERCNNKLINAYNEINALEKEINQLDQDLGSFTLSALKLFGYDDTIALENKKLIAQEKHEVLLKIIPGLDAAVKEILKEIKAENLKNKNAYAEKLRTEAEAKYLLNPDQFLDDLMFKDELLSQANVDDIYKNARQIIAASAVFEPGDNKYKLIKVLEVVSQARKRAFANYREAAQGDDEIESQKLFAINEEFAYGSKLCFGNMVDKLDTGYQCLKTLYQVDPERAEWYYGQADLLTEKKLKTLMEEVNTANLKMAVDLLAQTPGFNKLPPDVQKQLMKQQAYVNQLNFDLSYIDNNKNEELLSLHKYTGLLSGNIKNAIINNKSIEEIKAESDQIKENLNKEADAIRNNMFKQQVVESIQIPLGAGFGLAWIFGFGVPAAVAASAVAAITKATVETSATRLQMPAIDAAKNMAEQLNPEDFKFIQKTDERWQKIGSSFTTAPVKIQTLRSDAENFVEKHKDIAEKKFNDKYDEVVTKPLEEANNQAFKLYLGIIGMSALTLIAIGIALPASWPLFAALGAVATITFGYVFVKKAMNSSKPAPTDIGPLVDYAYDSIKSVLGYMNITKNKVLVAMPMPSKDYSAEKTMFMIPAESLAVLKKQSPTHGDDFSMQLSKHFNRRLSEINDLLEQAKISNDKGQIKIVKMETEKLEQDWGGILNASKDPQTFCEAISVYLEKTYQVARQEYLSNKKKPVLFSDSNENSKFKMDFNVDYSQKQKDILELLDLKEKIDKVKKGV